MRNRWQAFILALALLLVAWPLASARAQDQGAAVIISPLEGSGVTGIVPITGSATHPQFQRYELAFAYSPNPSETWFSIQEPRTAQILNESLGHWDTSRISDGLYALRLRVFYGDNAYIETFVYNVLVRNATPIPPPSATPEDQAAGTDATPVVTPPDVAILTATPQSGVIVLPPTSTPRPTTTPAGPGETQAPSDRTVTTSAVSAGKIGSAFVSGIRLTLISFLLLAAYVSLRAALRTRPRE